MDQTPTGSAAARPFPARPPWRTAPAGLREAVEQRVGSAVGVAHDVHGGMTPGPAAVLALENGTRVFAKAVSRSVSAGSHRLYRQEAAVLSVLPAGAPAARLVAAVEAGDWIALVTEVAPGQVAGPPWTTPAVEAVAGACALVAGFPAPPGLPPVSEYLSGLDGWAALASEPRGLTPWEAGHAGRLAAATAGWPDWTGGRHLTHLDIRCDNAVIDPPAAGAVLVDWSSGCAGARWLDRALLAADVVGAGHSGGPEVARRQALGLLADQPPEAARFVIALAGMWRRSSAQPAHPGMPTHRGWQRARATALRPLLGDLLALIGG